MKKNMEHFQADLKTVTEKIADLEVKCGKIEIKTEMSDADYEEYGKLGQELSALKERQNRILMLIHANH